MSTTGDLERLLDQAEAARQDAAEQVAKATDSASPSRESLALHEAELASADARVRSLSESIKGLDRDDDQPTNLATMTRTDAIVEILRAAGTPLSINEVETRLDRGGQESEYQVVASTLNYLTQTGRINRPTRGRYAMP